MGKCKIFLAYHCSTFYDPSTLMSVYMMQTKREIKGKKEKCWLRTSFWIFMIQTKPRGVHLTRFGLVPAIEASKTYLFLYQFFEKVYPTSYLIAKSCKSVIVPYTKIVKIDTFLYTNILKIDTLPNGMSPYPNMCSAPPPGTKPSY